MTAEHLGRSPFTNGGRLADEQSIARFQEEARAVGAGTIRVTKASLADSVAGLLQDRRSIAAGPSVAAGPLVAVSAGLEEIGEELRCRGVEVVSDDGTKQMAEMLPEADVGLGLALAGVAASGTVLIGPGSGLEGAIATLPPHHVVVLFADHVVPDLAAALAQAAPQIASPGSRLAFVTGPSRTSDIELTTVVGVHGPLRLDIVIVDG